VVDVAALLTKMGARIEGPGTSTIRVQGVDKLHGAGNASFRIARGGLPDRRGLTRGDLLVTGCEPRTSKR